MTPTYYQRHRTEILAKRARQYAERHEELKAYAREYYRRPGNAAKNVAANRLKRSGWSDNEYAQALKAQGGVCFLCRRPQTGKALAADHDHTTGSSRALLCERCNRAIGLFRDNPDLLEEAADYLRRFAQINGQS